MSVQWLVGRSPSLFSKLSNSGQLCQTLYISWSTLRQCWGLGQLLALFFSALSAAPDVWLNTPANRTSRWRFTSTTAQLALSLQVGGAHLPNWSSPPKVFFVRSDCVLDEDQECCCPNPCSAIHVVDQTAPASFSRHYFRILISTFFHHETSVFRLPVMPIFDLLLFFVALTSPLWCLLISSYTYNLCYNLLQLPIKLNRRFIA